MRQYTVPQFIDAEDKIFGPITTRQFIIFIVAAMVSGISYKVFDFSLFILVTIIIFGISLVIGFVKVNGRPFHFFVVTMVQTFKKPRLRVWRNRPENVVEETVVAAKTETYNKKPPISSSRLAELSLIADTGGSYKGEE